MIFVKTRKVGGTSIESALRPFLGDGDIVACCLPRDEYRLVPRGYCPRNYAVNREDEVIFNEMVRNKDFSGALNHYKAIDKLVRGHLSATEIRRVVGRKLYDSLYKVSIERHPYNWTISFACYDRYAYNNCAQQSLDLNQIKSRVKKFLASPKYDRMLNWYYYTEGDEFIVDHVMAYDHLGTEFEALLTHVGIDTACISLQKFKFGPANGFATDAILSEEDKDKIFNKCKSTFAAFGFGR